jgi:LPS-assembly protein
MMKRLTCLLLTVAAIGLSTPNIAQPTDTPATLVADAISVNGGDLLARGHVEIWHEDTQLRASAVRYIADENRMVIEGPIQIVDGDQLLLVADQADLSRDLQNGLLMGAQALLNQQLQIATRSIRRVDGRYLEMNRVTASSCEVCTQNPVPLWQIRASRVVHDEQKQQLYYEHAQFRLAGVPLLYAPRLRMPDPSLDRATGFLTPDFRNTTDLGFGIKLPYFIKMGDHRDVTLTPYLASKGAKTLEARYRQAFRTGDITLFGVISDDDITADRTRGWTMASGTFDLPRDLTLDFTLQKVSDPDYLVDYGYPTQDRVLSNINITRTKRSHHLSFGISHYESLRNGEVNAEQPSVLTNALYHRRFVPGALGGMADLKLSADTFWRESIIDGVRGRDINKARLELGWRRDWQNDFGMLFALSGAASGDIYQVNQDTAFAEQITRTSATVAAELRWPFERRRDKFTDILQPVLQFVHTPDANAAVPNEDGAVVEFDEGNLFALSRFAGTDAVEQGTRLNIGLNWTRQTNTGASFGMTIGRVIRSDDYGVFTAGSGLDGVQSDWLVTAKLDNGHGLRLTNRAVLDPSGNFAKNELNLDWTTQKFDLSSSYTWLDADPTEGRPDDTSEIALAGRYDLSPHWFVTSDVNYDITDGRASQTQLGLGYQNECVSVDFNVSRRYGTTTSRATTDFGVNVTFVGIGQTATDRAYRRTCRG